MEVIELPITTMLPVSHTNAFSIQKFVRMLNLICFIYVYYSHYFVYSYIVKINKKDIDQFPSNQSITDLHSCNCIDPQLTFILIPFKECTLKFENIYINQRTQIGTKQKVKDR